MFLTIGHTAIKEQCGWWNQKDKVTTWIGTTSLEGYWVKWCMRVYLSMWRLLGSSSLRYFLHVIHVIVILTCSLHLLLHPTLHLFVTCSLHLLLHVHFHLASHGCIVARQTKLPGWPHVARPRPLQWTCLSQTLYRQPRSPLPQFPHGCWWYFPSPFLFLTPPPT